MMIGMLSMRRGVAACSEGELVKLRCKLEGQPLPQVTWYFNEQEIEPSERYTIISDYREFILVVPRPTVDMTGQYRIVAKNQHGTKQMSTQLNVEGWPLFIFFIIRVLFNNTILKLVKVLNKNIINTVCRLSIKSAIWGKKVKGKRSSTYYSAP